MSELARDVTCPICVGDASKRGTVFVNTGPDWRRHRQVDDVPCSCCGGSGVVTRESADAIAWGGRMREARLQGADNPADALAKLITLGDAADVLGISSAELSAVETGKKRVVCIKDKCPLGGCPYHMGQTFPPNVVIADLSRAWWLGDGNIGCRWYGGDE